MIVRIKIPLEQSEYNALTISAISDLRDPVSQVRLFVREELKRRGLLFEQTKPPTQNAQGNEAEARNA